MVLTRSQVAMSPASSRSASPPKSILKRRAPPLRSLDNMCTPRETQILTMSSLACTSSIAAAWWYADPLWPVPTLVMVASVLFWHDARAGWRRNVDICNSVACIAVCLYCVFTSCCMLQHLYLSLLLVGVLFWGLATFRWAANGSDWVIWHVMFHLIGNASNFVLYHGRWMCQNGSQEVVKGAAGEDTATLIAFVTSGVAVAAIAVVAAVCTKSAVDAPRARS